MLLQILKIPHLTNLSGQQASRKVFGTVRALKKPAVEWTYQLLLLLV